MKRLDLEEYVERQIRRERFWSRFGKNLVIVVGVFFNLVFVAIFFVLMYYMIDIWIQ